MLREGGSGELTFAVSPQERTPLFIPAAQSAAGKPSSLGRHRNRSSHYTLYMFYMVDGFFSSLLSPTDHRSPPSPLILPILIGYWLLVIHYWIFLPSSPPRKARPSILKLCLSSSFPHRSPITDYRLPLFPPHRLPATAL